MKYDHITERKISVDLDDKRLLEIVEGVVEGIDEVFIYDLIKQQIVNGDIEDDEEKKILLDILHNKTIMYIDGYNVYPRKSNEHVKFL